MNTIKNPVINLIECCSTDAHRDFKGHAEVIGENSIAVSVGICGTASAALHSWIVLAEYDINYHIKHVRSGHIDGVHLFPNVKYILRNNRFEEVI